MKKKYFVPIIYLNQRTLLALIFLISTYSGFSQITNTTREYEERFEKNLIGNFKMIGNTNIQCVSNCATTPVWNNPPQVMNHLLILTNDSLFYLKQIRVVQIIMNIFGKI